MRIEIRTTKRVEGYEVYFESFRETDDVYPSIHVIRNNGDWHDRVNHRLSDENIKEARQRLISEVIDTAKNRINQYLEKPSFETETHYI